jgi:hypothetical protein
MKHLNLGRTKPLRAGRRLARTAVLLGVAGATAGSLLLVAATAQAATDPSGVGQDPTAGTLTFVDHTTQAAVTSGPGTELLNWKTSDACPSPDNVSATVATFNADTGSTPSSLASNTSSGPGPYAGSAMQATVASLFANYTDGSNPTFEVAVLCTDQATATTTAGAYVPYQYAYITYTASSNTFVISAAGPAKTATTTTLTSQDTTTTGEPTNTALTGDNVTFTATVADSDSTTPAGSILFQQGGTTIATQPVAALSGGGFGATATTSFATANPTGYPVTATFTPTNTSTYAGSNATINEIVTIAGSIVAPVTENLTVPSNGTITVTIDTNAVPIVGTTGSYVATGVFGTQNPAGPNSTTSTAGVQVADSRNTFPGWYVTGQTSNFTLSGNTIPGNQLGWAPNTGETWATTGSGQATLGSAVLPAAPGLGTAAATLFSAPAGGGFGTFDASAGLSLDIPTTAAPGAYTGTLTITAVTSAA